MSRLLSSSFRSPLKRVLRRRSSLLWPRSGCQARLQKAVVASPTAGKHTTSHGGHYAGGQGSSHRGGSYKNGQRYGTHQ